MDSPLDSYWAAVKHIMCYLNNTLDLTFSFLWYHPRANFHFVLIAILIGRVIPMISAHHLDHVFILVWILFHGAQRSNIWWLILARRLNIVLLCILRLSCFGFSRFYYNIMCHFNLILCFVITLARFCCHIIQFFMLEPNTLSWTSTLSANMLF